MTTTPNSGRDKRIDALLGKQVTITFRDGSYQRGFLKGYSKGSYELLDSRSPHFTCQFKADFVKKIKRM